MGERRSLTVIAPPLGDAATETPVKPARHRALRGEAEHAVRAEVSDIPLYVPGTEPLTGREREVLARIAVGETNKEAARRLGLSARTIEGYRANIMRKVGAKNAAELLRRVFSQGRQS